MLLQNKKTLLDTLSDLEPGSLVILSSIGADGWVRRTVVGDGTALNVVNVCTGRIHISLLPNFIHTTAKAKDLGY